LLLRLFALRLQLFLGAVAAISDAAIEKLARDPVVKLGPLRLAERTFVPIQTEPAKILEHHLFRLARGARHVRVFDAQNEFALVMPREEPVENRGARAADVQMPGGRGCETDADGHAGANL